MKNLFKYLTLLLIFIFCSFSFVRKPKTLEECNAFLDKELKTKDITYIKNLPYKQLAELHFSLGLFIRNNWIRGNRSPELVQYFNDLGLFNPDDISGIIIENYWHYLNKKEFDLKSAVESYKKYWETATEKENINKENIAKTEKKLWNDLIDIYYDEVSAHSLKLPDNKTGNQIFCDEFIKYGNGYIINSLTTFPQGGPIPGVSCNYQYIDLKTNELFKLNFSGFDSVQSVITIDSTLYISGLSNHKIKIMKLEKGKIFPLNITVSNANINELSNDSWIKLGVLENTLFALQSNGLYFYDGSNWQMKNKFDLTAYFKSKPIIPTENIILTKDKLYFFQEILQERSCELYELDLTTNTITEFWERNSIIDNYQKTIDSYCLSGSDTLFAVGQRLGNEILLSEQNDILNIYLLEGKTKSDLPVNFKINARKVIKNNNKVLIVADNGLFELKNKEIAPLVFFTNTEQMISNGTNQMQFNFKPRSFGITGNEEYLIGGQFGGLYLVDLKKNTIKCLDDNKKIKTLDFLRK